ncbi:hypothetical protein PG994_002924 [Apiospora phragmitis]|uniref:Uncharacterized protein n=1 Tax=Apiospora phragmitis TaxID=2905665 RepID=A0ABR1W7U7_9PEZI
MPARNSPDATEQETRFFYIVVKHRTFTPKRAVPRPIWSGLKQKFIPEPAVSTPGGPSAGKCKATNDDDHEAPSKRAKRAAPAAAAAEEQSLGQAEV